ncbi:MAG TPA: hypothetical protein VF331_25140 [Polyangiales bacterium]
MARLLVALLVAAAAAGCAGYSDRTEAARSALDAGRTHEAARLYNKALGVDSEKELPANLKGEKTLFVLDRSVILQALDQYELSSRDLEVCDKQIEILDFARGTLDDIAKYMFSDDAGPYQAPAYEKLMINTLNMVNYLVRSDLNGARIEARRLAVLQQFISEHDGHGKALSGPGDYLAGFTFEKSHSPGEALRYYDEALQYGQYTTLTDPVRRLAQQDPYRTPQLSKLIAGGPPPQDDGSADVLVVVSYGRVPAKIARRIPIGLALTYASGFISPYDQARANKLALQGLVTWVNFPELGQPRGTYGVPELWVDGRPVALEGMLAVDSEAQRAWKQIQGKVIASAITRMLTRVVAGEATRRVAGGGILGLLLGLGTQATLTATDTPDTRSWGTLPARMAFGRLRVPAGRHTLQLSVRGTVKRQTLDLPKGGWGVLNLTVLR